MTDGVPDLWRDSRQAAMPVTEKALLAEGVRLATGEEAVGWTRITEGQKSEVYCAAVDSGREVVVRVSRRVDCRFESERWALAAARAAGVPAPEMLHLERREDEHGPFWICVENRIPGRSLHRVVHAADLERLVGDAGEILGRLHCVALDGFGSIQPDGSGSFDSFAASMTEVQTEEELALAVKRAATLGIPEVWIRAGADELCRHGDLFEAIQPRLLHGDVSLGHFFTDGATITGLLDFEDAAGGDPAFDFIWWNYFRDECPVEWLIAGHNRVEDLGPEFYLRLRLGRLREDIELADYFGKVGNVADGKAVLRSLADHAAWFGFGR